MEIMGKSRKGVGRKEGEQRKKYSSIKTIKKFKKKIALPGTVLRGTQDGPAFDIPS